MKNRYDATVESFDPRDGFAWLRLGEGRVAARAWPGMREGQELRVSIRREEVIVCSGHPGRTSARNLLPGHVRSVRDVPEGVEVVLEVGFPLTALVTRRAADDLGLRRGRAVFALVKASAVAPEPEFRSGVRVSLVGAHGTIDPSRLDLLRALEREGSLGRAARALKLSYRTAWLWAREANRAWDKPLVAPGKGGRGGGGTTLTPEGRAAIRRAAEIEESRGDAPE